MTRVVWDRRQQGRQCFNKAVADKEHNSDEYELR
jgi:hypothetical protein